jgi:predicted DNA-binding transcriptional regulator YafY
MKEKQKSVGLTNEELESIYKIVKAHEENAPESNEEHYNDYSDTYEEPIKGKIIKSILSKISSNLPEEQKEEIDKDFLRKKYSLFNGEIDEKIYAVIEKAFNQLKTIEITYFNMESAEFNKRELEVYYKSRRYVIGYCHLRKEIRKFRTSKIASAKLTKANYKIPEGFDKNKY